MFLQVSLTAAVMVLLALTSLLALIQILISTKCVSTEGDLSSLESGFEALKPEMSFSSPFFILATLFVLFDLEVVLLFPGIFAFKSSVMLIGWNTILSLVLLTLLVEWAWCGLSWHV